jgi:hypothetical protein
MQWKLSCINTLLLQNKLIIQDYVFVLRRKWTSIFLLFSIKKNSDNLYTFWWGKYIYFSSESYLIYVIFLIWDWGSHSNSYEDYSVLDVTLCSSVDRYQCFGRTCFIHPIFYPEHAVSRFFWNITTYLPDYIMSHPRKQ